VEGRADADLDGKTTLQELFTNVRNVVYQLSDQRQKPVMVASPNQKLDSDVAFQATLPAPIVAQRPLTSQPSRFRVSVIADDSEPTPSERVIRLAALGAAPKLLSGLEQRETSIQLVASAEEADLIWDAKSKDVLAHGDVVGYGIEKGDLPSVADRVAAISDLKRLAAKTPQGIVVKPDDKLHHDNKKVVVEINGVAERALVIFNLASDGTVQLLYPVRNDPPILSEGFYRLPVVVRAPFGADQVVAVTSEQRMLSLEQALQRLDGRRAALQATRMVQQYAPRDSRIGSVGLFTAP
jgi:hypothetical protein